MKAQEDQKKGLWSHEEDEKLIAHVTSNGIRNWTQISKDAGLLRTGKSCRLRWMNYLRPYLKRGCFTIEEIQLILYHHQVLGNKWSMIASYLPGRTDNEIKNFWHTYIRKCFKSDNPVTKGAFPSSAKWSQAKQLEMNKQKRRLMRRSTSQSFEAKDSNTNTSIISDDASSFDFPILESYVPNEGNSKCVMKDGNVGTCNISLLSEKNRYGEGNNNEEGWIDKNIFADLFDDEFMFGMNSSSMTSFGCNFSSWENIIQDFTFPETSYANNTLSTQNLD